ncbi:type I 3-dehydroquinate dehydratase [Patescibacteria group bacterium]|nr:type I 3-dehydroquinate dehydratase [Patescibacteria group bacterium]MBU1016042.1 type I 3-dehydroquinate dehydratase [Patescibacteria group bacterium]MBU1685552.1 type I 3-dehydroquinate dehydratase [Patescibacteria group bacterium]MBU1938263.1 type I 3-dehydroquinate dehydratase [Patescibacteria group bacterium]
MKICIPIQAKTQKEALKMLYKAAKKADLAELWLDFIGDLDLKSLLGKKPLPVVCVCKRPADKGKFRGSFAQLSEILLQAIHFGADYVDIPFRMPKNLNNKIVQQARKKKCKIIISHHDFKATPDYPKLVKLADSIKKRGADVIKIATHANDLQDTINIISLASYVKSLKMPHILISMGQKCILSRILTPTLGGEMMFATLNKKGQTAPGQLSVRELRKAWSLIETK